jgi:hypothetical protein
MDTFKTDDNFLTKFDSIYKNLSITERKEFINHFLKQSCESNDLAYLAQEIEKLKTDFIKILPIEIIESIFFYVEPNSLFQCCQVRFIF